MRQPPTPPSVAMDYLRMGILFAVVAVLPLRSDVNPDYVAFAIASTSIIMTLNRIICNTWLTCQYEP